MPNFRLTVDSKEEFVELCDQFHPKLAELLDESGMPLSVIGACLCKAMASFIVAHKKLGDLDGLLQVQIDSIREMVAAYLADPSAN